MFNAFRSFMRLCRYTADGANAGICGDGCSGVFYYDTQTDTVQDIILDTDSGHAVNFTLLSY